MNSIVIRFAEEHDVEALTHLYNYYIEHSIATFDLIPHTVEERLIWFHEHRPESRYKLLVAESNTTGEVVGYASSSRFRSKAAYDTSVETSIYIKPGMTGRGIGTLLYSRLLALLEEEPVHRIYACIAIPNESSLRLHRRFGFISVGLFTEAGYKHGAYRDIQWLEKRV